MAAARALARKARKGSIAHFQEAANRLEGKVESSDESAGNVVFNITISAPRPHRPPIEVRPRPLWNSIPVAKLKIDSLSCPIELDCITESAPRPE